MALSSSYLSCGPHEPADPVQIVDPADSVQSDQQQPDQQQPDQPLDAPRPEIRSEIHFGRLVFQVPEWRWNQPAPTEKVLVGAWSEKILDDRFVYRGPNRQRFPSGTEVLLHFEPAGDEAVGTEPFWLSTSRLDEMILLLETGRTYRVVSFDEPGFPSTSGLQIFGERDGTERLLLYGASVWRHGDERRLGPSPIRLERLEPRPETRRPHLPCYLSKTDVEVRFTLEDTGESLVLSHGEVGALGPYDIELVSSLDVEYGDCCDAGINKLSFLVVRRDTSKLVVSSEPG